MISHIERILYYKNRLSICASVRSVLNAFFSATAGPFLTKLGMKMTFDSGFMNPEN